MNLYYAVFFKSTKIVSSTILRNANKFVGFSEDDSKFFAPAAHGAFFSASIYGNKPNVRLSLLISAPFDFIASLILILPAVSILELEA